MSNKVNKTIQVDFEKLNEYKINDTRFTQVKIWLMHLDENYNGSIFTKEVTTNAIPSLANTPILGYIQDNSNGDDDFSDHRIELERNNNDIKLKYKGSAYGVIPETNYAKFENKICKDGKERTFLTCQGLLWNKFDDALDIFNRDIIKDESMELSENYTGHFNQDGYFVFDTFLFDGACALGSGVQPAMEGACIEVNFSLNEIKVKLEQFQNYINNQSSNEVDIKEQNSEKGGQEPLAEEIKDVVNEVVELITETTEEIITDTVNEEVNETPETEEVVETQENFEQVDGKQDETYEQNLAKFSATYRQKREALQNALEGSLTKDADGNIIEEIGYWVSDFDDSYIYVEKSVWTNNDYNCENGRFGYSFNEETLTATITSEFEQMIVTWLTIEENNKIQEERNQIQTEYARLKEFEVKTLKDQYDSEISEIFSQFEKQLSGVAEFETLKNKYDGLEVSQIEEKCFALLGKKNANFSVKPKENVVKVPYAKQEEEVEDPYGGLLSKVYNK
mgnify:CR=1 FL=1